MGSKSCALAYCKWVTFLIRLHENSKFLFELLSYISIAFQYKIEYLLKVTSYSFVAVEVKYFTFMYIKCSELIY